jgi:rhamnose utilization protein RhaD (predicted bifunctional aldolase and dehydrogenase)
MPKNLWNEREAAGLNGLDLLVYRSRLLGADRAVCNIYGGNTGSKMLEEDMLGEAHEASRLLARGSPARAPQRGRLGASRLLARGSPARAPQRGRLEASRLLARTLWVKGSGSDLATIQRRDFAGLRMDAIEPLRERNALSDEEMTAYLSLCYIGANMPRQSIETLLHGFIESAHTDHTHPDAIISVACSANGQEWTRRIYGERAAWVDYIRPGFALSKQIARAVREHAHVECVVMGNHGLVTWGDEPKACYDHTIAIIQAAEDFLADRAHGQSLFGTAIVSGDTAARQAEALRTSALPCPRFDAASRQAVAGQVMPVLRGAAGAPRMILHFDDSQDVLDFAGSARAREVALAGAACPDHLVHTKRVPLCVDWDGSNVQALLAAVRAGMSDYITRYESYFEDNKQPGDTMFNPAPRIVLIPGVGMLSTGKDAQLAQVSADLYHRAIAVMGGASALDQFVSLTPAESYGVEYWPLELYKLSLRPPERELRMQAARRLEGASRTCRRMA